MERSEGHSIESESKNSESRIDMLQSFDELYALLREKGRIQGTRTAPYDAEELIPIIENVRNVTIPAQNITRGEHILGFNLREKVKELLEAETKKDKIN